MHILVYGINYAPELTGIGKYTGEMCAWLVAQGHVVEVITAMPYYPEWKVDKSYRRKVWHIEMKDGVKIYRCPLYVPNAVSPFRRMLHETSFFLSSSPIWLRMLLSKKHDLVISIIPPFHLGFMPYLYRRLRKVMLISHIQDLQVDAARDLNMLKSKMFLRLMFWMEKFYLKNSSYISTISQGMQNKISAKGIADGKIILLPNWVDERFIRPLPKSKSLRGELGLLDSDKVILYSGNLGEKQGLENIVHLAGEYLDDPAIKFVICGSGGTKNKLQKQVAQSGLKNVRFLPLQPLEKLSALLAIADVHLVLQKRKAADLMLPSKLSAILAVGGCAIVTAMPNSTLYEMMDKYHACILVEPENKEALRTGISEALESDTFAIRKNALSYAERFLVKEYVLKRFEQFLIKKISH